MRRDEQPVELLPGERERIRRVLLLGEAAEALLRGELPPPEARLFIASALQHWLARGITRGGSLDRDFLRVTRPRSHRTATAIWRERDHWRRILSRGGHPDDGDGR